jgi:hypothetical protein
VLYRILHFPSELPTLGLLTLLVPEKRLRRLPLRELTDETTTDSATGAVRSVQQAELVLPRATVEAVWSAEGLERLARTYWRFMARATLGLLHVHYTPTSRSIVFIAPPFRLLTFQAPEYEMDANRGVVRWKIERGILVDRAAQRRGGAGYLQIEAVRNDRPDDPEVELRLTVAVANFYPAIALKLSRRLYNLTQSKIHVLFTRAFLRSLARLGKRGRPLPRSKVGRLARRPGSS